MMTTGTGDGAVCDGGGRKRVWQLDLLVARAFRCCCCCCCCLRDTRTLTPRLPSRSLLNSLVGRHLVALTSVTNASLSHALCSPSHAVYQIIECREGGRLAETPSGIGRRSLASCVRVCRVCSVARTQSRLSFRRKKGRTAVLALMRSFTV